MAAVLFHIVASLFSRLSSGYASGPGSAADTSNWPRLVKSRRRLSPQEEGCHWKLRGAVAQLGERLICIQEVVGSIPISSTSKRTKRACSSGG